MSINIPTSNQSSSPEQLDPRRSSPADEALRASETRYRRLFEAAQDGILILDATTGKIEDANPFLIKILGYSHAELLGKQLWEIGAFKDIVANKAAFQELQQKRYIRYDDLPLETRGGANVFVEFISNAYEANGKQIIQCNIRDNTARKQAEEALLKAGALQRAIFNSPNFSSIATDAKGVIQIFNVGAERMLGYAAADVINKITPVDISDPKELVARAEALSTELGTPITPGFEALVFKASRGIEDIYELTYIRKDGSRFPAMVSVTALREEQNGIIGFLLIGTDNTARQQVEEERMKLDQKLRDQHFYTRSLIESNIDALMTTDPRGIITDINKQTEALTGCTRDELVGSPFKNYFTDPERARAGIKRVLKEGKVTNYELTARARGGGLTVVSYNATTFHDRDRRLQGVFVAARDVTELKQFEHTQQRNVELADASRLKSEFLANMSHELRSPLNNMLILSQLLFENAAGNLSSKQVEFARTIHSSGHDLLQLINDILDLSKIESGKMSVEIGEIRFQDLEDHLKGTFSELARDKGLGFLVHLDPGLPPALFTDNQRILQVLRNLLSNAFKFTERGGVTVTIAMVESGWSLDHPQLGRLQRAISFAVQDTGIGISIEKRALIFGAFRQADGSTSRKYGGTGLGLSISREIASILGGEIAVKGDAGEGSTFTFYLPELHTYAQPGTGAEVAYEEETAVPVLEENSRRQKDTSKKEPADDRRSIQEKDRVLLIVEDDPRFARVLLDMARGNGFKGILALDGGSALAMLESHTIAAIMLDIRLPDMDGWGLLDRLKRDVRHRHIPVQVVSADDQWQKSRRLGAITHVTKPMDHASLKKAFEKLRQFVDHKTRVALIVDPDEAHRHTVIQLLKDDNLETMAVANGPEALKAVGELSVDCVVLDISVPDRSGFDIVSQLRRLGPRDLPIIVYSGFASPEIRGKHAPELNRLTSSAGITAIETPQELLDETALRLHRQSASAGAAGPELSSIPPPPDALLANRKVLVVDDDLRNIFALTGLLEQHEMRVLHADNARDGIELLKKTPDLDAVLMDIMMPDMDGYAAIREIRSLGGFADIRIIAVTARAMKGDREKCLAAGASDYIAKPVNVEQLLSLLRVGVRDVEFRGTAP